MTHWTYDAHHLQAVAAVLKRRFTNLTVEETIRLTAEILDAVKSVENSKGA